MIKGGGVAEDPYFYSEFIYMLAGMWPGTAREKRANGANIYIGANILVLIFWGQ